MINHLWANTPQMYLVLIISIFLIIGWAGTGLPDFQLLLKGGPKFGFISVKPSAHTRYHAIGHSYMMRLFNS